ncbi:MAG: GNAT family N-acetyltransferase [Phenylobacterium sp.]|uniref:GNAT family N-acetyltransferase n=1 Tax=Phenylobacterium sp. TaxID=1871053 RepID=UPI00272661AF|nr:GNAT family N-acetyltransferase [Phenylobacterium sp.]MDO8411159.1 GNAT family N-acetyltransferase [Phenylobacterium sp.]
MTYTIAAAADPGAAYMPIWAPLLAFNQTIASEAEGTSFALTLSHDGAPAVAGGLWALALWGSFYIGLVVVPEHARGQGFGRELMRQAEDEARRLTCRHMWLDTYAFQARPFYERLGFEVFGQLDGPSPIFPRYFMQKRLAVD